MRRIILSELKSSFAARHHDGMRTTLALDDDRDNAIRAYAKIHPGLSRQSRFGVDPRGTHYRISTKRFQRLARARYS